MAIEEEASSAVAGEEDETGLLIDQSGAISVNKRCLAKASVTSSGHCICIFFKEH
ncbi:MULTISPECIES: hypothetical protein [unclassified Anaerobiospirillum]|uniref:hypothetical protein n=1 Tax=unclassified Anaerobiospirillum TaxID=2647410 RepID=UPI001FF22E8F|nr:MULTISPECIES: hypothetical protein [unclassified Anaerobiospirillum]MCK0533907.1 hypothetical protein [Anaerobiospirillum sp. NML120511]MCK0539111.1 hypothetical protein [Anaerobiospirillum sp. NML02-A-032]